MTEVLLDISDVFIAIGWVLNHNIYLLYLHLPFEFKSFMTVNKDLKRKWRGHEGRDEPCMLHFVSFRVSQ